MATLQQRNGSYRVLFYWHGKKESFTLGAVPAAEAESKALQVDYLLMRLKQGLLTLPEGVDITNFVAFDGKPPAPPAPAEPSQSDEPAETTSVEVTLDELRRQYIAAHSASLEASSIATIGIHFGHLTRGLGEHTAFNSIGLGDLQKYVNARAKSKGLHGALSPETIRKEIASFRGRGGTRFDHGTRCSLRWRHGILKRKSELLPLTIVTLTRYTALDSRTRLRRRKRGASWCRLRGAQS